MKTPVNIQADSMDELLNFTNTSQEVEEEQLTSAEVLQKLEEAWKNEKLSPNLMLCKPEIVECVLEQMNEMEENIERAKKNDIKISLHRLELDRIRYILSSYLRSRLEKIEKHAATFLEQEKLRSENEPSRLSPEEFNFAKEFVSNVDVHLKASALKHMPRNLQTLNLHETVAAPNLDHYVFLVANKDEEGVVVEPETDEHGADRVDFEVGAQHIMRYRPIEDMVENGALSLI